MRKPRAGTLVRISNPAAGGARTTSLRRALEFVARGRACWLSDGTLHFHQTPEILAVNAQREDQDYWRGIAAERGGRHIAFRWRVSRTPVLPGTEPRLGYGVMGADIIVT